MDQNYRKNGYKHFHGALPADRIAKLGDLIDTMITPYPGEILRQNGQMAVNNYFASTRLVANSVLNAHLSMPADLAPIRDELRALLTSSEIYDCLHGLDGADHYTVHQTIIFVSAQVTAPHFDGWSLDTAPRGLAHTLWIPLEDVDHRAGLPAVVPWPVGKILSAADLGISAELSLSERYMLYAKALADKLLVDGTGFHTSFMPKGDFFAWGSLTPHFSLPSTPSPRRRLSLQVLVRPTHCRWGTFETQPPVWTPDRSEQVSDHFAFLL